MNEKIELLPGMTWEASDKDPIEGYVVSQGVGGAGYFPFPRQWAEALAKAIAQPAQATPDDAVACARLIAPTLEDVGPHSPLKKAAALIQQYAEKYAAKVSAPAHDGKGV
jgi:hypothetical protein